MGLPEGFNWFIILVTVVVAILVLAVCIYILVDYSHPEDRNQAWFPKIVVVFSLWLAICSVLMFPLDVANNAACSTSISPTSCTYTLPMAQLWMAVFIANIVLAFAIIPFTLFFYEADSDFTFFQKIKSAIIWTLLFIIILAVLITILYALVGYVEYPTQELTSGVRSLDTVQILGQQYNYSCIPVLKPNQTYVDDVTLHQNLCDAFTQNPFQGGTWKLRVSLVTYIMAIQSVIGWILFLIFAGIGVLGAPIDWIQQFLNRPKATITKSEYIRRAKIMAQRAKTLVNMAAMLRRQNRDRKYRTNLNRLNREVVQLEEDEYQLERVFPQGEDGEARWVLYMIGIYMTGIMGVIGLGLSIAWLVHIILYMLPPTPIYPFLNTLFVTLDNVFALLGVAAFALFCLYLMVCAVKGNFLLGLNFLVVKLYPMRAGATLMSAFLVNMAIILIMTPAILQFCAQAFAVYADGTDIFDVFGNQVMYLMGIKWLYNVHVFLYMFFVVVLLSIVFMLMRKRQGYQKKRNVYMEDD